MSTWHESDHFWETLAPVFFRPQRWEVVPAEVEQVIDLLEVDAESAILDLCCGPGRHALELARRSFRVTGVDRTATYLERARERAQEEGLDVEFVLEDARRFCRPDSFDTALSMFTSFGYFEDPDENRQVLSNVYRSLRDGGALILDLMGKEVLARIFQERSWEEYDDILMLEERSIHRDWSWVENRWIVLQGGERHEFAVSHWVYSAAELCAMLKACGFDSVTAYGDLEGAPYDHEARRLVVVARK
jgi:SAM-dependent methyltransferase